MYLVDTSVWIHALRSSGHSTIQTLLKPLIVSGDIAITDWILLELMTGLSKSERPETLIRWFMPVHRLPFEPTWWEKTWNHAASLRKRGFSPGAADCLIATVAMEHRVSLLHCDTDFETMKSVLPLETADWTPHLAKR